MGAQHIMGVYVYCGFQEQTGVYGGMLVSTGPINLDLVTPMLSMGLWPGIQFQKLHSSTPKVLLLVSISTNPPHMYGIAYIVELYSGLPSLAY